MKIIIEFEGNENMTSIGFANSLINAGFFNVFELQEISCYLNTYCTARSVDPKYELANKMKVGAE